MGSQESRLAELEIDPVDLLTECLINECRQEDPDEAMHFAVRRGWCKITTQGDALASTDDELRASGERARDRGAGWIFDIQPAFYESPECQLTCARLFDEAGI